MPQAVDIVVNDGAPTPVAKTFTLLNPSAGLNSIAEWALKAGAISSVFPRFTAAARNSPQKSKVLTVKLRVPSSYVDSVSGLTLVGSSYEFNGTFTVPNDFPEVAKDDAVAFTVNIVNDALLKAMIRDALPAT
jgi:hypothetical protein